MIALNPQYITDTAGNRLVVLRDAEFEKLLQELEELEDIRLYDEVKKSDNGTRTSLEEYIVKRKLNHA
ncbi:hypothetical protein GCM10011386_33920 [Parapedobacter defluvii]|uniref:Prevent-host-death family protein n=1 Tax=Parapedobacter defluvii TaxID=2045106 RepID=A0ABQ1ME54_9SPHI|nr:hypothetical protein [Parapedobacter defluvii]RQP13880.1 MAG: hypothetical protein EAS52_18585 [Parapedobacter sp.]GGC39005.1 hypothetical protein GCM10011386_33920 [Parapedobacter defluvii]